jgi:hypothetical protein
MVIAAAAWGDEPNAPDAKPEAAQEAAQPSPAEQAPAAEQTTTEQATPQATEATSASADAKADDKPFKAPPGYRAKRINGKQMYCAENVVLGSRFGKEKCRTEAQLRAIAKQQEEASMRSSQQACSGATPCVKN